MVVLDVEGTLMPEALRSPPREKNARCALGVWGVETLIDPFKRAL